MAQVVNQYTIFIMKLKFLSSKSILEINHHQHTTLSMSQQLGNEVERQGKARQTSQLHPGQLFLFEEKKKSCHVQHNP